MQNKPELQDIIRRWIDCPDEVRHLFAPHTRSLLQPRQQSSKLIEQIPECAKFKVEPMHDQAVLNNYIVSHLYFYRSHRSTSYLC